MKIFGRVAGTILLAAAAAGALSGVRETVRAELPHRGTSYQEIQEARSRNAFAGILGEIRATTADLLYAKSLTYRYNGVVYATPSHPEESGERGAQRVRSSERDFRGIIGFLERQVKPYERPDALLPASSDVELMPWYRLMTVVDPSNINGYINGAHALTMVGEYPRALQFIEEGMEKNAGHPLLFHLNLSKAIVHSRLQEFEAALAETEAGIAWARQIRPEGGEIGVRVGGRWVWSELAEEDFFFLVRYRALFLLELGRREEALQAALEAYRLNPEDVPISRMLERLISGH